MKEVLANSRWLRVLQIAIGAAAIGLSIAVIAIPKLAPVTAMVIFAIVLFIVGVERIASGIGTEFLSRRSRMINIGIGAVVLFFAIITIAFPQNSIKFLVLIVGLALLFNGVIRVIDGVRKSFQRKSQQMFRIATGAICIVLAGFILYNAVVLSNLQFGIFVVVVVMVVALVIQGSEIIYAGIKGEKVRLIGKR
ncbi:MAG TPA: DUF308 domain-containing protein [Nitrososphaeraceae archaeon]|jgi:uncharacterized membrane protein HdeD (DUF308 family)|nr:DUF308 domain-containing protein [Nitrososphaeraceae archaeon]